MSTRAVLQVFENYQKARVNFVQTVAELAQRPQNVETLQNAGVMQLLRPLLLDNVSSIQHSAAIALGRLASYNDELAEAIVSGDILPQLVYSLGEQNVSVITSLCSSCFSDSINEPQHLCLTQLQSTLNRSRKMWLTVVQ